MSNGAKRLKYDIVLLDADETVFDFKRAEAHSLKGVLNYFGIEYSDARYKLYSGINQQYWKKLELGEVTREELKFRRYRDFFDSIGVGDIDIDLVNDLYATNLSNSPFLINGAKEFVVQLHKYCRIYLATNGLIKAQSGRLSQSEIKDHIDGIFISEQMGCSKPDKEYFDFIFNALSIKDKSRVIIMGDSLTSDMRGGRNAGITTCLFSRSPKPVHSELCDYEISDYNSFFDIIFE